MPEWLDQADAIAGTDLPKVLCCRLRNGVHGTRSEGQILDRGLQVAATYPNSHALLVELGDRSQDRLLGASLLAASLFDHWESPIGSKADELYELAWVCDLIGREDVTQELKGRTGSTEAASAARVAKVASHYAVDRLAPDPLSLHAAVGAAGEPLLRLPPVTLENVMPARRRQCFTLGPKSGDSHAGKPKNQS